jgi:hypothetical protein
MRRLADEDPTVSMKTVSLKPSRVAISCSCPREMSLDATMPSALPYCPRSSTKTEMTSTSTLMRSIVAADQGRPEPPIEGGWPGSTGGGRD